MVKFSYDNIEKVKAGVQMSANTYLWIEDQVGKASYQFWTIFMRELCPAVIVESKKIIEN